MPLYTFGCRSCGYAEDRFFHMLEMSDGKNLNIDGACPKCSGTLRRQFTSPQVSVFQEYVTPDITGEETVVTSPRQEKDLCRRHGVIAVGPHDRVAPKKRGIDLPDFQADYERTEHAVQGLGVEGRKQFEDRFEKTGVAEVVV